MRAIMPNCAMTPPKLVPTVVSTGMLRIGTSARKSRNGTPIAHWVGRAWASHHRRSRSPTPLCGRSFVATRPAGGIAVGRPPSGAGPGEGAGVEVLMRGPSQRLPRMPVGRNIRTMMRSANATTSRHSVPNTTWP